jgi:DnaK suppressor protein
MTPQKRTALKKLLEAQHREALGQKAIKIEGNRKGSDVDTVDEDAQALSEMVQVLGSQRNKAQVEKIARLAKALRKIKEEPGEYGLCEECEEEIAIGRLEAMPDALLCTTCQGEKDPRRGQIRKKITDYQ